jgi:phenylalanyl-tRNA synthetase beta chain
MKFSYNWLQSLLEKPLPPAAELGDLITFHSAEIEELIEVPGDTVLDVKVLPDKSAWLMSHLGMVKEIAVITKNTLKTDLFLNPVTISTDERIKVSLNSATCDFYSAALITGVKVGPSPDWLKERLEALGQRSINNIVDATNYVMFELGQPLHAFDVDKLSHTDGHHIVVRDARAGEKITTLTGEEYTLSPSDALIVDGGNDTPVGIAGVKGGAVAAVDAVTANILLESAHFDRFAVRKTAKTLRLQTDASKRYENGICRAIAPIALSRVIELILEVAGGTAEVSTSVGDVSVERQPVTVTLSEINSLLGVSLTMSDVEDILNRFTYTYTTEGDSMTVTPPFERDDLVIPEDLVEEIGRMYGLGHIVSIPPTVGAVTEINVRHYYSEKIRETLMALGFSEVYTSSFRNKDVVKLENALATDKGYLRSSLVENLREARTSNVPHRDLLGLTAVKIFEIGTVFGAESEEFRVGLAVQTGTSYKAKVDDPLLEEALTALATALGVIPELISVAEGIAEFSLDVLLPKLPAVTAYDSVAELPKITYRPFSLYPAVSRDIAMWVPEAVTAEVVEEILKADAGPLCVRLTHVDTFSKEGRTSLAFRLVFQSFDKTLTDEEVQGYMDTLYKTVENQGWEAR